MGVRSLKIHVHQAMRHECVLYNEHVASYKTLSVTDGTVTDVVLFHVCSSETPVHRKISDM